MFNVQSSMLAKLVKLSFFNANVKVS